MVNLSNLQDEMHEWRKRNFPNADATQQLLGVVEEVGELSHAHLKGIQGIRGMDDDVQRAIAEVDAIGDIMIYLMGYCSYQGWDMQEIVNHTWNQVKERNWQENSATGIVDERAAGGNGA